MNVAESIVGRIRHIAEIEDIPVLGIGPTVAMEDEPRGHRPSDFLPGTRSMVCFGIPAPRAVYQAGPHATELTWRTQNLLYRRLDTLSLAVAQVLEAHGARAMPLFGCCPLAVTTKGIVTGYVNQLRMGELTGIGIIGRNGLLLNRGYGARLMLGGALTSIDLPAARFPDEKQPDCPADCRTCIESCPVQAISRHTRRVNVMRCLAHTARTPLMSKAYFGLLAKLRPTAAARFLNQRAFDEHTMNVCSRCVAACPYGGDAS